MCTNGASNSGVGWDKSVPIPMYGAVSYRLPRKIMSKPLDSLRLSRVWNLLLSNSMSYKIRASEVRLKREKDRGR
jgi:hypothetical protein